MSLVQIKVEFYSKKEKELLKKNWPFEFPLLERLSNTNVKVPFSEFKTYSQFHHQTTEKPKYSSFTNIQAELKDLFGPVDSYTYFSPEDEKFTADYDDNNEQDYVSMSIGNAGVLSVLSQAYNLTQADWRRINIQGHKDFDFDSAVVNDFTKLLVVEAKGSIVPDNCAKSKSPRIHSHKYKIKQKKQGDELKKNIIMELTF
ncbi:hypothetical protein [Salegentibacter sp. F14]